MASQISTTLAHSYNSRGELGSFVNPETCSCRTCTTLVAAPTSEPIPLGPAETMESTPMSEPAPGAFIGGWVWRNASFSQGTGAGLSLQRSATNATETPSRDRAPSLPPPPAIRRAPSLPPQTPRTLEEEESDILKQLASFRATLQLRQDKVYEEEADSHSDMAIQDMEWVELDEKIAAVESLLSRFRYPFRTR